MITYRQLNKSEYGTALALTYSVFLEFEAPDYPPQGVTEFYNSIHDTEYLAMLSMYGAFDGETLVGILATRSSGTHIALLFVNGAYHRRNIGKQLFWLAAADCDTDKMTVNSSPYAVEIYKHLGFTATSDEQTSNGIRYTPMECILRRKDCPCKRKKCERHGNCVLCREHHKTKKKPIYCERVPNRKATRMA